MKARPKQCATCIFRPGDPMHLGAPRLGEIRAYLVNGSPHICHHSPKGSPVACRGGRDYQLEIWHRLGIIPEATDEALAAEMIRMGLDPPENVR